MAWPLHVHVCAWVFAVAGVVTRGYHGYRFGSVKGKSQLIRDDDNDRSDEEGDDEEGSRVLTFGNKTQPAKQMQVGGVDTTCLLSLLHV